MGTHHISLLELEHEYEYLMCVYVIGYRNVMYGVPQVYVHVHALASNYTSTYYTCTCTYTCMHVQRNVGAH